MSLTYTWSIVKVGTRDQVNSSNEVLSDAIVYVQWKKVGTDNLDNRATYVGETELSAENVAASDFTSYDDVTNETIIDWLEATITDAQMTKIDNVIAKKIANQAITMRDR